MEAVSIVARSTCTFPFTVVRLKQLQKNGVYQPQHQQKGPASRIFSSCRLDQRPGYCHVAPPIRRISPSWEMRMSRACLVLPRRHHVGRPRRQALRGRWMRTAHHVAGIRVGYWAGLDKRVRALQAHRSRGGLASGDVTNAGAGFVFCKFIIPDLGSGDPPACYHHEPLNLMAESFA